MISIPSAQKEPSVYWIGDSTVQFNHMDTWPQCGMGQVLDLYLRPGITVHDHAKKWPQCQELPAEGLWEPVYRAMQPGDLLLIQFGHNDEKEYDPRATPRRRSLHGSFWITPALPRRRVPIPCWSRR